MRVLVDDDADEQNKGNKVRSTYQDGSLAVKFQNRNPEAQGPPEFAGWEALGGEVYGREARGNFLQCWNVLALFFGQWLHMPTYLPTLTRVYT